MPSQPDPETIRETVREVLADPRYQLSPPIDRSPGGSVWEQLQTRIEEWWQRIQAWLPEPDDWRRPVVFVAAGMIAATLFLIVTRLWRGRRRQEAFGNPAAPSTPAAPDELERLAEESGGRRRFAAAVRLLLKASILRLEAAERRINRPGLTNRELLRRYRATPLYDPLARLVQTVDVAWYAGRDCTAQDYELCREANRAVRRACDSRMAGAVPAARA